MSRHFSDPYVAALYRAIETSNAGITPVELQAEHPEQDPGDYRAAIAELRAAGAIALTGGRYWARSDASAAPAPTAPGRPRKTPLQQAFAADMRAMQAADPQPTDPQPSRKETAMPKGHTSAANGRANEQKVLEWLATPGRYSDIALRAGGAMPGGTIKTIMKRLRASGQVDIIGGGPKSPIYALAGTPASAADSVPPPPPRRRQGKGAASKPAKPAKTPAKAGGKAGRPAVPAKPERVSKAATKAVHLHDLPAPSRAPAAAQIEGFRCGLFSDGSLSIVDGDCEMALDPARTAALVSWLDKTLHGLAA